MPSAKVLEQKQAIVAELTERLKNSVTGVLVNYKGINVADDTALRKELREAGVQYSVVKNTLLSRACEEAELTGLQTTLAGTTALATCDEDYAAAARILCLAKTSADAAPAEEAAPAEADASDAPAEEATEAPAAE